MGSGYSFLSDRENMFIPLTPSHQTDESESNHLDPRVGPETG